MSLARLGFVSALFVCCSFGCDGETVRGVTSAVVEKGVEMSKGAVKGVAEGVAEGRKSGRSLDEATVVTSWSDLAAAGDVQMLSAKSVDGTTEVELSFENRTDTPLRLSDVAVLGLDEKKYSMKPVGGVKPSVTVPPNAKEKLVVTLQGEGLSTLRIWDHELAH